jgi:hypothetical protein
MKYFNIMNSSGSDRWPRAPMQPRQGALLSYELILIMPILLALGLAMIEFSLLWSAKHKIQLAAQHACRVGTHPCPSINQLDQAVRAAADMALVDERLIDAHRLTFRPGAHTGDPVVVEVKVPMTAASPDMLSIVGYSIRDRFLTATVVMSKE